MQVCLKRCVFNIKQPLTDSWIRWSTFQSSSKNNHKLIIRKESTPISRSIVKLLSVNHPPLYFLNNWLLLLHFLISFFNVTIKIYFKAVSNAYTYYCFGLTFDDCRASQKIINAKMIKTSCKKNQPSYLICWMNHFNKSFAPKQGSKTLDFRYHLLYTCIIDSDWC